MIPKKVIIRCFVITVMIFTFAIFMNYILDFARISTISKAIQEHEQSAQSFAVEQAFLRDVDESPCTLLSRRLGGLISELRDVGGKLGTYSGFSWFRKEDYDYLKRKYFLLELHLYTMVNSLSRECAKPYVPIIFFYEIDDDDSERQGFILDELSDEYESEVFVVSFDKDYEDEPLVMLLAEQYGVEKGPVVIIDDEVFRGLTSAKQLNVTVSKILNRPDPFSARHDMFYTPHAAGANITLLEKLYWNNSRDDFAEGDVRIILGRLTKNESLICESLPFFDAVSRSNNTEERALAFETIASVGCGRNRQAFFLEAADAWKEVGADWRAEILEGLAGKHRVKLKVEPTYISPNLTVSEKWSKLEIGRTKIVFNASDLVVPQVDRVHRDWLGGQIFQSPYGPKILKTFSERLHYAPRELREEIGWHEGGRLLDIMPVNYMPAVGTMVVYKDGKWFAPDVEGVFRFEVPLDKVLYPTTRFLREDIAVIIDTHGVNMLAEQAVRLNASVVWSDCDNPGKVAAAKYLSDNGVSVVCFPDKYIYLALGHNLKLVGSPPLERYGDTIVVGNRPITIDRNETIVAVNATNHPYALWYYQTPTNYFRVLEEIANLSVIYVNLDNYHQMSRVIGPARMYKARVIAARVTYSSDYLTLRDWLKEDHRNRVILFHSSSYPYGQLLFREFPEQTSFDDPNPRFI